MEKKKKNILFGIFSILGCSIILGIGLNVKNIYENDNLVSSSPLNLTDDFSNNELNEPNNNLRIFTGVILEREAVISLGWHSKTTITLADWAAQAPNVRSLGYTGDGPNEGPFSNVLTLRSIQLPPLGIIGPNAFRGCSNLANVTFSANIIGSDSSNLWLMDNSFLGTALTSVSLPDTTNVIQSEVFGGTSGTLKGNMIDIPIKFRTGSTAKYGFTQEQWNAIEWRPAQFTGTILTKTDVEALKWNTKAIITLDDWNKFAPNVTQISVTATSGSGDDGAFSNNSILQSIQIPDKVTTIAYASFFETTVLRTVTFTSNSQLTTIGNTAFRNSGLLTIILPNSLTSIGNWAFDNSSINSINIPDGITVISDATFRDTTSLRTIIFTDNSQLSTIESNAFIRSGISSINIPNGVTSIASNSFSNTSSLNGAQISMSSSLRGGSLVEKFGFSAIQWNSINWIFVQFTGDTISKTNIIDLNWHVKTRITLNDWTTFAPNVTTIGTTSSGNINDTPFGGNAILTAIDIPPKIVAINYATFANTSALTSIIFSPNSSIITIGNNAFSGSVITAINLPDSVTSIGNNAFLDTHSLLGPSTSMSINLKGGSATFRYGFTQLQWNSIQWRIEQFHGTILTKEDVIKLDWNNKVMITLSDWQNFAPNVTQISPSVTSGSGDSAAFSNNTILQSIIIPSRVTTIHFGSFYNTTVLTTVSFESNSFLETIGDRAFRQSNISGINLPNRLTSIGTLAFDESKITSISIPDTVTSIATNSFQGTNFLLGSQISMSSIFIQGSTSSKYGFTQQQWDSIQWRIIQFKGTTLSKTDVINLNWQKKSSIILSDWSNWAPNVTEISTTDSSGDINVAAFSNNSNLQLIQIPSKISSINSSSFINTISLTTIIFEENSQLTLIGNDAFNGSGLIAITIPHLVNSIGSNAFENTNSLIGSQITMKIDLKQNSLIPQYGFTQTQWDNINWISNIFTGSILTKADVEALGWNTKISITLLDWETQAPNVTQISTVSESGSFINAAFSNNTIIQNIQIPAQITLINYGSFANTPSLSVITFAQGTKLVNLGNKVFDNSGIISIEIPDSVNYIGIDTFINTNALVGNRVSIPSKFRNGSATSLYGFTQQQWDSIQWRIIQFQGTILSKADVINLDWHKKTSITLSDWSNWAPNVTQISPIAIEGNIYSAAFSNNAILQSIVIPAKVTLISYATFLNTTSLTSISFEDNSLLKTIGNSAFTNSSISSINIPTNVKSIGNDAFSNTSLLKKDISIPYSAFSGDEYLKPKFGFSIEQWNLIVWTNIPKTGMINLIIAKELLRDSSIITWDEISQYDGIKSQSFSNTNISSIVIKQKDGFIIENDAFINTNLLKDISMSIQYEPTIKNYGFTIEQEINIKWLHGPFKLSKNSIILVSSLSGVFLIVAILNIIIFKNLKKISKLEELNYTTLKNSNLEINEDFISWYDDEYNQ